MTGRRTSLLTDRDTIVSTQSYNDRSFGEQTVHFTYAHTGYLSTVIGCADFKFSFIYRDGDKLQYDLIRTTDSQEHAERNTYKHTFIKLHTNKTVFPVINTK